MIKRELKWIKREGVNAKHMKKHMIYINFEDYDFVVEDFKEKFYIQVANILSDGEVFKREFGAYDNENDNYPKYVLTMDKIDYSRNGIIYINIIEWLLENKWILL